MLQNRVDEEIFDDQEDYLMPEQLDKNDELTPPLESLHFSSLLEEDVKTLAEQRFPDGSLEFIYEEDFNVINFDTEINVFEDIARGAFGKVCRGTFHNENVALKFQPVPHDIHERVNLLVELSIMQSYPHEKFVSYKGLTFRTTTEKNSKSQKKTNQPDSQEDDIDSSWDFQKNEVIIIMDFCERGNLRECVSGGHSNPLPFPLRIRLLLDVIQGISFLHNSLSILHLDIKTLNVLVDREWRGKICDFSFACLRDSTGKDQFSFGTEEFMAPEVLLSSGCDFYSDIFSFGILMCEVLTGYLPTPASSLSLPLPPTSSSTSSSNPTPPFPFLLRTPASYFELSPDQLLSHLPPIPSPLLSLSLPQLALDCCEGEGERRPTCGDIEQRLTEIYLSEYKGGDFQMGILNRVLNVKDKHTPAYSHTPHSRVSPSHKNRILIHSLDRESSASLSSASLSSSSLSSSPLSSSPSFALTSSLSNQSPPSPNHHRDEHEEEEETETESPLHPSSYSSSSSSSSTPSFSPPSSPSRPTLPSSSSTTSSSFPTRPQDMRERSETQDSYFHTPSRISTSTTIGEMRELEAFYQEELTCSYCCCNMCCCDLLRERRCGSWLGLCGCFYCCFDCCDSCCNNNSTNKEEEDGGGSRRRRQEERERQRDQLDYIS